MAPVVSPLLGECWSRPSSFLPLRIPGGAGLVRTECYAALEEEERKVVPRHISFPNPEEDGSPTKKRRLSSSSGSKAPRRSLGRLLTIPEGKDGEKEAPMELLRRMQEGERPGRPLQLETDLVAQVQPPPSLSRIEELDRLEKEAAASAELSALRAGLATIERACGLEPATARTSDLDPSLRCSRLARAVCQLRQPLVREKIERRLEEKKRADEAVGPLIEIYERCEVLERRCEALEQELEEARFENLEMEQELEAAKGFAAGHEERFLLLLECAKRGSVEQQILFQERIGALEHALEVSERSAATNWRLRGQGRRGKTSSSQAMPHPNSLLAGLRRTQQQQQQQQQQQVDVFRGTASY